MTDLENTTPPTEFEIARVIRQIEAFTNASAPMTSVIERLAYERDELKKRLSATEKAWGIANIALSQPAYMWPNKREELGVILREKIGTLTVEEWCDYWRDGSLQHLLDEVEQEGMVAELACASTLIHKLIFAIRCWNYESGGHLTFAEVDESLSEHYNAMRQAMY